MKRSAKKKAAVTRTDRAVVLSIVVSGDEPPTEFRIFAAGTNETKKGDFVFDEAAADSVMSGYAAHGIDLMIDYDHASIEGMSIDPALARKAAGWFNLELRSGELWAVNVRWTEPAAEALRRKEWRFMSPAFHADGDRVVGLLNVAITNLPATHRLAPLMAASVTALGENAMSVEEFLKVCKALDIDMSSSLDEAMSKIKGEESAENPKDEPAKEEPAAEPAAEMAADPAAEEEKPEEVLAASARLMRLSGKTSVVEAINEVEVWRKSHIEIVSLKEKVAKETAALELGKRKENAAAFIKLGAETPFTSGLSKGKLCKRLLEEPLEEQTDRVKVLLASRGGKLPADPTPPPGGTAGTDEFQTPNGLYTLSAREVEMCATKKIDPAKYAANRASIRARSNVKGDGQ